jgi:hypothetical protein
MDISLEYIKMCEKAHSIMYPGEEIVLLYDKTSLYWHIERKVIISGYEIWNIRQLGGTLTNEVEHYFPLYRQDQLQEIGFSPLNTDSPANLAAFFDEFCWKNVTADFPHGWSMEQLWLAFVMKEKFNKTWNGEEWVNK